MRTAMTLFLAMTLTALTLSTVIAATLKCEVSKIEGTMVILDCGEEADKLKAGVKVKVKTEATTQAIEGC